MRRRTLLSVAVGTLGAGCTARPSAPGDLLAGRSCPQFRGPNWRSVCYRDRGDAALYLEPPRRALGPGVDREDGRFVLHNEGDRPARFGSNDFWTVARHRDGGWRVLDRGRETPQPEANLVPAGATTTLALDVGGHEGDADPQDRVVATLNGSGVYAFAVHVDAREGSRGVSCVALFEYVE